MKEEQSSKILLSQQFTSFEELAEMVVAWNLDFRQISTNFSATVVEQIMAGNVLYSHLSCGCFATHAGETPKGMCTISLPDTKCPEFRFHDQLIDQPVLLISQPGQEFNLVTKPGYGISNFSIPYTMLDEYSWNNFGLPAKTTLESLGRVIRITLETATKLRSLRQNLKLLAQIAPHLSQHHNPIQSFHSQLLESLFEHLHQDNSGLKGSGVTLRASTLKRALEFSGAHEHEPLTVEVLAKATCISPRTLQRVFKHEFGMSPKKYLFGKRMSNIHRQLWQSSPLETRIVDVANSWGFWHMGQFAKDYRNFFGELPSETLNRTSTN